MEMKRKTYLILIWSITLCVIVCSSTITFIKSKEIFTKVWNDVRNELEESFDFDFKFMSKNNDWNLNDNDASDFSNGKEFRFRNWRYYLRMITAEEIAHNYAIEKARFNLS